MTKQGGPFLDIAALLADGFNEETARLLLAQGEEVAIFVMLQLAALAMKPNAINDGNQVDVNDVHLSEPSGSVATYLKPTRKKGRKKPGAKQGHKGFRRPPPENRSVGLKVDVTMPNDWLSLPCCRT